MNLGRTVTLAGLLLAVAAMRELLGDPSAAPLMLGMAGVLTALHAATAGRLRRAWPVTEREVLGHVLLDMSLLLAAFYGSGGATNPFVDLFLVPLAIAAARLPRNLAIGAALFTAGAYLFLAAFHVPLPGPRPGMPQIFDCLSAWVEFVLCAGFVAYLVYGAAAALRERDRTLEQAHRRSASEEYLMRTGFLAAGVAHEIRSPLCTMAVVVNELLQRPQDAASRNRSLALVAEQIDACRRILAELMTAAQDAPAERAGTEAVDGFLQRTVDKWRVLRPGVEFSFRRQGMQPAPRIATDGAIGHGILNLLNNAADASPYAVEMVGEWTSEALVVRVLDRGPGIPVSLAEAPGESVLTTKRDNGTGIGLLLARMAAERAGGSLRLANRPGGGACAELVIPLLAQASAAGQRAPVRHAPFGVGYFPSSRPGA